MEKQLETITLYRIQGGISPNASLKSIQLKNGRLAVSDDMYFYGYNPRSVFFGDYEFVRHFYLNRLKSFKKGEECNLEIVKLVIPKFCYEFIEKNLIKQVKQGSRKRPIKVNHGPGLGFEFNFYWRDFLLACAVQGDIERIEVNYNPLKKLEMFAKKDIKAFDGFDTKSLDRAIDEMKNAKPIYIDDRWLNIQGLHKFLYDYSMNEKIINEMKEREYV